MFFNPELRRNVGLYFTPHRMILTLTIISIIVYIAHLTGGASDRASISYFLMVYFIFFWGTKNASEAVIEEINLNTWDFQRQLPITPWSMTIGKLMGSTLFGWYGAFICMLIYVFSYSAQKSYVFLGRELLILFCGGIFAQSIALLASLQNMSNVRYERKQKTLFYFLLALFIGGYVTASTEASQHLDTTVQWFQFTFSTATFSFASLILFTAWSIVGLERSFSIELQYQTLPLAWIGFSIFLILYFSGLSTNYSHVLDFLNNTHNFDLPKLFDVKTLLHDAPYYIAFFIAEILVYLALFTESLTTIRYKKLILRSKTKSVRETMLAIPLWPLSFLLILMTGTISLFKLSALQNITEIFSPSTLVITSVLFVMRDILLVHYFTFDTQSLGGSKAYLIYLPLLYLLFPGLLSAMGASHLNVIFLPSTGQNTPLALGALCIQIVLIGYFCRKRWHRGIDN